MQYLKPLIRKLTSNEVLLQELAYAKNDEEGLNILLKEIPLKEIEETFSRHYGVEYKKIDIKSISQSLFSKFDKDSLRKEGILPYAFDETKGEWSFAISDLTKTNFKKTITKVLQEQNQTAVFTFAFKHEVEEFYNLEAEKEETDSLIQADGDDAVVWVDAVINRGIDIRASDIHIERKKEGLKVRYRVDGMMMGGQVFNMSDKEVSNVYVRLKVIGNMDISEKRKSQDGRIDNYEHKGNHYTLRVSTLNTIAGEKFVLRVFPEDKETATFNDLGFSEDHANSIKKMLKSSNGIIYLAGATGSGKTTTLYSMIEQLDKETMNIYTVENPSEKTIEGVNQVQVDEASKNTYPSVLKTLLRQDPDVIVIGEIRESETAKLAVQASLTGHLVLTTIHANNAVESISRLTEMQIENYLLGASSVGFISQRLVRVLCPHCKKKKESIPEYQKMWIEEELPNFNYEQHKHNGEYFYSAVGCDECVNGYRGRVAVLEIIEVDETVREMIAKKATTKEIRNYLVNNGYKEMRTDGINKALKGITSLEELIGKLQN